METLLETCSLLAMNRLLLGGGGYEESLGVWKELVGLAGGPLQMLEWVACFVFVLVFVPSSSSFLPALSF